MKKKSWTVQILPRDGTKVRNYRVSARIAVGAAAVFLLVAGAMAVGALYLSGETSRAVRLAQLQGENQDLRESLRTVERRTATLSSSLDELASREERFRLVAGLPLIDPDVQGVGIGGSPASPSFSPSAEISTELDRLSRRADLLSSSISEATDSLHLYRDEMQARPSIRPVASHEAWISSSYNRSRHHPILLQNRPHEGIDISARAGAPVLAAARGTITRSGWLPGYGKFVEIDHGYGYRTRYAHASRLLVRKGAEVKRGDVIAEVGETGLTTGPNLHYEVIVDDRPVNPRPYLLGDRLFQ